MSREPKRILGIDTSLRGTGVGVIECSGNKMKALGWDVLKMPPRLMVSDCLAKIRCGIIKMIEDHHPVEAAIEGAFFFQNAKTAMTLGLSRGVAIEVCSSFNIPVYEYAPRKIKQAVTGSGGAGKDQVGRMITTLLNLKEQPAEDACDALAIAICHSHGRTGHAALLPERI